MKSDFSIAYRASLDAELAHYVVGAAKVRQKINALTRICRLPPETLGEIFVFYVQEMDEYAKRYWVDPHLGSDWPTVVSQVCHHWREVALATPRLWTKINVDNALERTKTFLERSKQAPLHVVAIQRSLSEDPSRLVSALELLVPELKRTESLHTSWSRPTYEAVRHLVPASLPSLRSLSMDMVENGPLSSHHPFADFIERISIPDLAAMHLHGYLIPWKTVFPAHLTHLTVTAPSLPSRDASMRHVTRMMLALSSLPFLELLTLDHATPHLPDVMIHQLGLSLPSVQDPFPLHLDRLRYLTIASSTLTAVHILNHFDLPASTRVTLRGGPMRLPGHSSDLVYDALRAKLEVPLDRDTKWPVCALVLRSHSVTFHKERFDDDREYLEQDGHMTVHVPDPFEVIDPLLPLSGVRYLFTVDVPITPRNWTDLLSATPRLEVLTVSFTEESSSRNDGAMTYLSDVLNFSSHKATKFSMFDDLDHWETPEPDEVPSLLVPKLRWITLDEMATSTVDERRASLDAQLMYHIIGAAEVRRKMNALTPICRLPPETLGEIFRLFVEDMELYGYWWLDRERYIDRPLVPAQVCHYWREVAVGTPWLWTRITVDNALERTRTFITRSKQVPLTVTSIQNIRSKDLSRFLSGLELAISELHRALSFHASLTTQTYDAVAHLIPLQLPLLKSLTMISQKMNDSSTPLFSDFFRTHLTPRLKTLDIRGHRVSWAKDIFPQHLLELTVQSPPEDYSLWTPSAITEVMSALQSFPSLKTLSLAHVIPPLPDTLDGVPLVLPPIQEAFVLRLPRLRYLTITSSTVSALHILDHFDLRPSTRVALHLKKTCPWELNNIFYDAIRSRLEVPLSAEDEDEPICALILRSDSATFHKKWLVTEEYEEQKAHLTISVEDTPPSKVFWPINGSFPLNGVAFLFTEDVDFSPRPREWVALLSALPNLEVLDVKVSPRSNSEHMIAQRKTKVLPQLCAVLDFSDHGLYDALAFDFTDDSFAKPKPIPPTLLVPYLSRLSISGMRFTEYTDDWSLHPTNYTHRFCQMLKDRSAKGTKLEKLSLWCGKIPQKDVELMGNLVEELEGDYFDYDTDDDDL
ncbi:hypothetical protein EIP91_008362 [Steccherinum ochraceum]|uniref:F-box domain-containing protein n=1 Tax=Steccherinum ochraceum TaxID=92696 RepID=A0A4R0R5B9_9APHY|nr:hypothetical protein EIP91_008362 [Steccherinum ochraceum]